MTARGEAAAARAAGFAELQKEQQATRTHFWKHAQVRIKGDLSLLQGMNFNMFQLLQSAGRGGRTNISAKGLSGEGYEGHYFWDTEMYMLPFFLYTEPQIARDLLSYRYNILDEARSRAKVMGHSKGALFPWRTISGAECSAYFPAGTAQYHVNADVAFAVRRYLEATGDLDFAWEQGLEMLVETAAFWLDLGFYNPEHEGQFCIQGVTGPDEYNVMVNNNYYTNILARTNMEDAAALTRYLQARDPRRVEALY